MQSLGFRVSLRRRGPHCGFLVWSSLVIVKDSPSSDDSGPYILHCEVECRGFRVVSGLGYSFNKYIVGGLGLGRKL